MGESEGDFPPKVRGTFAKFYKTDYVSVVFISALLGLLLQKMKPKPSSIHITLHAGD